MSSTGHTRPLQPQVRVAYDYYPFGLTWHNPAAADTPEGRHDHAYQDKEFQWNEFGAGAGMALYDFHARMYDPATARWLVPDPAAQFANPYLAMGNSPVKSIDPDGEFVIEAIVVGTLIGAYVGGSVANNSFSISEWDFENPNTYIGIGLGAVLGGIGGYHVAAAITANPMLGAKLLANSYAGISNVMYSYESGQSAAETLSYFASGYISSSIGLNYSGPGPLVGGGVINTVTGIFNGNVEDGFSLAQHFVAGALATQTGKSFYGSMSNANQPYVLGKMDDKFFSYGIQGTARDFTQAKDWESYKKKDAEHHVGTFFFSGLGGVAQAHANKNPLLNTIDNLRGEIVTRFALNVVGYGLEYIGNSYTKGNYQDMYHKDWEDKARIYLLKSVMNIFTP